MWTLFLWLLVACGAPDRPTPRDPDAPEPYRVLRGDTWATIASKRSTTPEELRGWNDLAEDDLLVPGQILWIYRKGKPADEAQVAAAPEPTRERQVQAVASLPTRRTVDIRDAPDAADAPIAGAPKLPPVPRVPRPGMALLSLLDDAGPAPDLATGPSVRATAPPAAGLALRGDGLGHGDAVVETVDVARPSTPAAAPPPPSAGIVASLPRAQPKRCLAVDLADPGEDGMVTAEGLDRDAIVAGMRPVVRAVDGCLVGGSGRWEVHLEVVVGCDGLVYDVAVIRDGGLPSAVTACVAEVARQGSFAAAAAATTFQFPLRLAR